MEERNDSSTASGTCESDVHLYRNDAGRVVCLAAEETAMAAAAFGITIRD